MCEHLSPGHAPMCARLLTPAPQLSQEETMAQMLEHGSLILEATAGYRAQAEAQGFGPEAAELMAASWHTMVCTAIGAAHNRMAMGGGS